MIDTLLLHYCLPKQQYNDLFQKIKLLSNSKNYNLHPIRHKRRSKCYGTLFLQSYGILEFVFCKFTGEFTCYLIELKIRPKQLIDHDNIYDTTSFAELPKIRVAFNCLMKSLSPILPELDQWICHRVDYAVNIKTPYPYIYVNLFKRGHIKKSYQPSIDKMLNYKDSFYLPTKSRNITINFYDKYKELLKANRDSPHPRSQNYFDAAKNILRLEVQCRAGKLANIRKKFMLTDTTPQSFLQPSIAFDVIMTNYLMLTKNSQDNFISLAKSRKLLQVSELSKYTVLKTYDILHNVESSSGLWHLWNIYCRGNDNLYHRTIKQIEKAGINPVLIPANYKINELPNLKMAIHKAIFPNATVYDC